MKTKWNFVFLITLLILLESETINESSFRRPAEPGEKFEVKNYRLPTAIAPKYYDLSVSFKNDFSFSGVVKINATVQEITEEVVLHYGKIYIESTIILINDEILNLASTNYDPITEKYTIKLQNVLPEGTEILIAIDYFGFIQNGLKGLYKMKYVNRKGETKEMAATQFQPVQARHAFPCFDEPAFKAVFKIRIQRPSEYITLSNMPLNDSVSKGPVVIDIFEESVQMSTYLVAFIVSDLKSMGNDSIKVWTREDVINQAKYALEIGKKSLEYLEFNFGQQYQLEKLDMVALPETYFGGMENWGLITYRESAVLYDENDSSAAVQQTVAALIAHECTHMWFGNLVTPDWWGFLWLSEAFANYYEFETVAEIEPKWKMDEQIILMQQDAFFIDALPSSVPMTRVVYNQSEIIGMADTITYDKGASILRMMELSFGSDVFKSAVESYLQEKKYKTGKPEDFFSRIQVKVTSKLDASVETIMNTWTKQSGYPVLSVTVTGNQVKLKQNRFFLRKPNSDSSLDQKWWIPITWSSKSKPTSLTTTDKWINDEKLIQVERKEDDWIIFNVQSAGFYRVNYDTDSWYRIIDALKSDRFHNIHVLNRAAIINDLMSLARANLLDYDIALAGLEYLKNETSYVPFKSFFNSLGYLTRRFSGQPEFKIYLRYIITLIRNVHGILGFVDKNGEDRPNVLLRQELNLLSCKFGNPDCIKKSLKYFNNWKNGDNKRVPKNLKHIVYMTAIKHGTQENWAFLWKQYETTNIVSEEVEILNALSCSQDSKTLDQYLHRMILNYDAHKIRKRDLSSVISSVASCSLFGVEFILDFVAKYYKDIVNANEGDYKRVSNILSQASPYLSTQNLVDKFEQLIQSHYIDFDPIMPSLKSQLELAKYELNWYKRNSKKIVNWIQNRKQQYDSENSIYIISD